MSLVTDALSRLTGQFANSPLIRDLVVAIVGPLDDVLGSFSDFKTKRWIDSAEGVQLDGCGDIVGEPRNGREDEEYRNAIRFRVFVNISQGTPINLIQGLKFLGGPAANDVQYLEAYPATAMLFTNADNLTQKIQTAMQDLSPAGIATVPVAVSFMAPVFRFSKESPPGELFVNNGDSYLTGNGSDINVTSGQASIGGSTLGGAVSSDLDVGIGLLGVGTSGLAIYNPNTLITLGNDHLAGVFQ